MKVRIAFFLVFVFMSLIAAPAIINLVNDNQEVTSILDTTEEENKNEELEKELELEFKISQQETTLDDSICKTELINATIKNYFLEISKKNTPPPELYI